MQKGQELTVGPAGADITGTDNQAIQVAVDALWARGGGWCDCFRVPTT